MQFFELRRERRMRWLGLMSGTSCDGIDAAVVEIIEEDDGPQAKVVRGGTRAFPDAIRCALLHDLARGASLERVTRWHSMLGVEFAATALDWTGRFEIDAIAMSGHTFGHFPEHQATLQLGNPNFVAEATRVPVVAGFRESDVARGGEGAPLVPIGDRILFQETDRANIVVNFGGISNLTYLPAGTGVPSATDCGPGNLVLNACLHRATREPYDIDGRQAMVGRVSSAHLDAFFDHPFFGSGRRSTGREQFGEAWIEARADLLGELVLADQLATLSAWVAESVARVIERLAGDGPHRILVGGGGANHRRVMQELERLTHYPVARLSPIEHGVDANLREAAAFAILGHEYLHQRPGSRPTTTGCQWAGPLGALYLARHKGRG